MSDLDTAPANQQKVTEQREKIVAEATQPLVVITEQQVAFSTAAAMPLPQAKPKRGPIAIARAFFAHSHEAVQVDPDDVPPPFYPPRRDEFMEDAAMGREMYRL